MIGQLTKQEIKAFLDANVIGRIGCSDEGKTYIVPVSYMYKENSIIAHSRTGMKIEMMRKNPQVCFAVDEIKTFSNWKSIIAWGRYEEISDPEEKRQIVQSFLNRIMHLKESPNSPATATYAHSDAAPFRYGKTIVYRIVLQHMTGRFETDEHEMA